MDLYDGDEDLAENYLSDDEILKQFDEIEKSARALWAVRLKY